MRTPRSHLEGDSTRRVCLLRGMSLLRQSHGAAQPPRTRLAAMTWEEGASSQVRCGSMVSHSHRRTVGGSEEELPDPPKRRRARKHKSRKSFKNPNNDHTEPAELEKQQSLLQEKSQPQPTDGPTISRNKKRKLKKKQQMKRKKAAGLLTAASGRNFMYQPEEGDSEQGAPADSSGDDEGDDEEDRADVCGEHQDRTDANEEDVKSTDEKADGILNFLKSTQEIYFYDGACTDGDSAVSLEACQELLQRLEDHSVSPSDVLLVDDMKTLLLLRDTTSLQRALERFPACCTMPPDQARVLSAFFNYWITHILPEKQRE